MAEMYETLQTQTKQQKKTMYAFTCLCILAIILTGFTLYYVVDNELNQETSITICTTPNCVALSDQILSNINESVDPCDDFYHYACDGWIAQNRWELTDDSSFTQFNKLEDHLKQNFLDHLLWSKDKDISSLAPVQKAKTFYESCYKSTTTREDLQSNEMLKEFIQKVNFSIAGQDWSNPNISLAFQDALAWLNQREWNNLFQMNVYFEYDVLLQQNVDFWRLSLYQNDTFCAYINETFVPLFIDIFNVNDVDAQNMGYEICEFTAKLEQIGNYPSDYLDDASSFYSPYFTNANFTQFQQILYDSQPLNMTRIIYQTFESKNVSQIYYFGEPDIEYLNDLSNLLQYEDPMIVQLFLFSNVLWYFLDYEQSWQWTLGVSRSDFCYEWTVDQFPFVFGYIAGNTLYNDEKFDAVTKFASSVQNDGILHWLLNADWLDEKSRATAISKAANVLLLVGYPDTVFNATGISDYYAEIGEMSNNEWLSNIKTMNDWYIEQNIATFTNNVFPMLAEWPILFSQKDNFPYWLTGVNAFYYPGPSVDGANFFVVSVPITQKPFFDAEYPSAINFGGLGSLAGQQMAHGFDEIGFQYDINGTYVGSIYSNETVDAYEAKTQCFVDQYDEFSVERDSNVTVNGTLTQTDNIADNIGLKAAYLAWQTYKKNNNEKTKVLPGVGLNEKQLFFWSFANMYCDANRQSLFDNYTSEYTPNYVKVIGALQNSEEFADAFGCKASSFMSRENKCKI